MYTVKDLSRLTGLTPRTLRYYDTIGLPRPQRSGENGYRLYGPAETDRPQQILLYRDMGLPLVEIKKLLDAPGDPAGTDAREAVRLHAQWLARHWPAGKVTPGTRTAIAEMYTQDQRFTAYYEAVAPGCAAFLAQAVKNYYQAQ